MTASTQRLLSKIKRRAEAETKQSSLSDYKDFENDVHQVLCSLFPYSVLESVRLFSPSQPKEKTFGFEIDNLIHLHHEGVDYIIVIEAKNQEVTINGADWECSYYSKERQQTETKKVNHQVSKHIKTLREYISPIAGSIDLQFAAIVVSASPWQSTEHGRGNRNSALHLCSIYDLPKLLSTQFNTEGKTDRAIPAIFRVHQSQFLNLLRLGQAVPTLGHPECTNAIRYVERCRRELDAQIFREFKPTSGLWAINGSAGMGKSVLLAYTACVLTSGYELAINPISEDEHDTIFAMRADKKLRSIGMFFSSRVKNSAEEKGMDSYIDLDQGEIGIMAMSHKQLESLQSWYDYFVGLFQRNDPNGLIRFRKPQFFVAGISGEISNRNWAALLVDEAHDLKPRTEQALAKEHQEKNFFLCVACDRHQKLQHVSEDAKLIEGLNFSLKTNRLFQIYRNPTSIYVASLALMFRWFAQPGSGPIVIPTKHQLDKQFGFRVKGDLAMLTGIHLSIMNDAHPANSWSHTVASFPDVETGFNALTEANLEPEDILWVRFSQEDSRFDYEKIQRHFTYHNCRTREAVDINDKYIKGQDFNIVVIEGFPSFMDDWGDGHKSTQESQMWKFRRELYLCASRATTFLYFINNSAKTEQGIRIRNEIDSLVAACSAPANPESGGTKKWKFHIPHSKNRRQLKVFTDTDLIPVEEQDAATPEPTLREEESTQTTSILSKERGNTTEKPTPKEQAPVTEPSSAKPKDEEGHQEEDSSFHGHEWKVPVHQVLSVAEFALLMEVQHQEIVKTLNKEYSMQADAATILPISLMSRIASEHYETFLVDESEPTTAIGQAKKKALDIFEEDAGDRQSKWSHIEKNKPKITTITGGSAKVSMTPVASIPKQEPKKEPKPKPIITIQPPIVVTELAECLDLKPFQLMADLIKLEIFVAPHQAIEPKIAKKLCQMHGYVFKIHNKKNKKRKR